MTENTTVMSPLQVSSLEAWEALTGEWPICGWQSHDLRRPALLGILSFLGLELDEKDLQRVGCDGSDKNSGFMTQIERLLQ